ncbi:hypothetical protein HBA55_29610 [Pseudomaricurvus alkylphenolicus]|uniref:hypothetical protein n=1 Tax=Pseudomaricurvus alkylphenolicus TaxID=1306991 RepID=UPI0014202336|nr:hypothetical protein [Pseudomaricurvus alkylphenolicus]NIB43796.1 hypothetical protein [Pseudomaricurvus alkylphenolicus]
MKMTITAIALCLTLQGCQLLSACAANPAGCADVVTTTVSTGKTIHDAAKAPEEETEQ